MLDIDRILFPTDFSDCSERAHGLAALFADRFGAELHGLHAVFLQPTAGDETRGDMFRPELTDELEGAARERLAERLRAGPAGAEGEGRSTVAVTRRGISPAQVILEYVREADVDLVVMGTHGRGGIGRLLLGSVAREVVREADCPVITVRAEVAPAPSTPPRRIGVPVDFSGRAARAVDRGRALAEAFGAELHVLHIVEEPTYPDFYYPLLGPGDVVRSRPPEEAEEGLRAWLERHGVPVGGGEGAALHVTADRAAAGIPDLAERHGIDLLVQSSRGRRGVRRMLLGSVAEEVVRSAPCPVYTFCLPADEKGS